MGTLFPAELTAGLALGKILEKAGESHVKPSCLFL
jgi:hypothetical protein